MEACKRSLTNNRELQTNVDWITEVIRRFSDAALAARPFTAVSMKHAVRIDKVGDLRLLPAQNLKYSVA